MAILRAETHQVASPLRSRPEPIKLAHQTLGTVRSLTGPPLSLASVGHNQSSFIHSFINQIKSLSIYLCCRQKQG